VGQALPETYTGLKAAVQGHYADQDQMYPPEKAEALQEQIRRESDAEVEFFFYEGGHAFHNDENLMGTYDADLAKLAWDRAVDFLRKTVA
ncbi:MAG: dienelactone hydrolase family protein, partial [Nesterenkonia sp.]